MADTKIRNLPVTGLLDDDDCFVVATNSTTDTCSIKWSDMASEIGLLNQIASLEARLSTPVLKYKFVASFFGTNGFQYNLNSLVPNYSSSDIVKVLIDDVASPAGIWRPYIITLPPITVLTIIYHGLNDPYKYKYHGGILYTDSNASSNQYGIVEVWGAL
jgi:hypothetical protein